jgi:hypothetical protein
LRLTQSAFARQLAPSTQGEQSGPPQSTLDSPPFFTMSMQDPAALHTPATQLRLTQSGAIAHADPSPHRGQAAPPQSTSVSVRSFTPFEHAAWATQVLLVQSVETQSAGARQLRPNAQGAHSPPQSMSDSC